MGYYRSRVKCECGKEWNTFFCSVDMSSGMQKCPCGGKVETIADEWKMDDGRWESEVLSKQLHDT